MEKCEPRNLLATTPVEITIENLADTDGLHFTPVWLGFHNGGFEVGQAGRPASDFGGLEELAEDGDTAPLSNRFTGIDPTWLDITLDSTAGPTPVFEPGETVTQVIDVVNSETNRYLSYASMVIPSNDAFFTNGNPLGIQLFDDLGNFLDTQTIDVYGSHIWDAGTEVNDPLGGAAFAAAGGTSADEAGVIRTHPGLDDFVGAELANGTTLSTAFINQTPIARITITSAAAPIGPIDSLGPAATLRAMDVGSAGPDHVIDVIYSDPSGVDVSSIGRDDLRIVASDGRFLSIESVTTDAAPGSNPRTVTASYRLTAGQGIDQSDNGQYQVHWLDNSVRDLRGNSNVARLLGDFAIDAGVPLEISIENFSDDFHHTPFWIGVHDGSFEVGRAGDIAANYPGLELLAEEGDTSELQGRFDAAQPQGTDTVIAGPGATAGVIDPREVATSQIEVQNTADNRFFSFASMVIPSNDAFLANLLSRKYELFDAAGQFRGPLTVTLYGRDVWDAGTEVNDPQGGAAFTVAGGTSQDENGVIRPHAGLDDFQNAELPNGRMILGQLHPDALLARITVRLPGQDVPTDTEPPTASVESLNVTESSDRISVRVVVNDPAGIPDDSDPLIMLESKNDLSFELLTSAAMTTASFPTSITYEVEFQPSRPLRFSDNGTYNVSLVGGSLEDRLGNVAPTQVIGDIQISVGTTVDVTVENLSPLGGLANTPVWVGIHDGSFDLGTPGQMASGFGGLEDIAETGSTTALEDRFATNHTVDGVLSSPAGQAPVFEPGEQVTQSFVVARPDQDRYFSFASMLIPSNDAFVANLDAQAYPIFDEAGNFVGPTTFVVYGRNVWDAGTEVNNPSGGAAFSTGGGDSVDENGVIHLHLGLDDFIGTGLPIGSDLLSAFDAHTPLMRITIGAAGDSNPPVDGAAPEISGFTQAAATTQDEQRISLTYSDASGIDVSSIDASDLLVERTDGRFLSVTAVETDAAAGTSPRTVTATYTVRGQGPLQINDNGSYRVRLRPEAVSDVSGNAVAGGQVGELSIDVPVSLEITVENLSPIGGLSDTPFWLGFHDGSFDLGTIGQTAASFGGLEELAETGDTAPLADRFATENPAGVDAALDSPAGQAPVFEPEEMAMLAIDVPDPHLNRYFSYASMVIPSNDAFIGNLNSRAIQLFGLDGEFLGPRTIEVYGRQVWDAGTEVNSPTGGAAFSTGGGDSVDENGVIHVHLGLDDFIGTGLPIGGELQSAFDDNTPLARITIGLAGQPAQPLDRMAPEAELSASPVVSAGNGQHTLQVRYTDPSGVDLSRIAVDDLRISGSQGSFLRVTGVTTDAVAGTNPRTVVATYTFEPSAGTFDFSDNGFYQVYLQNRTLRDTVGNINSERLLGEIQVDVGVRLKITVENRSDAGGLLLTPFWVGFHEGNFDVGSAGESASGFGGLEELAEEGDVAPLRTRFATELPQGVDTVIVAPEGFAGAPVFEPGESVTHTIDVRSPDVLRFLSYASMVIPSNDAFIGNLDSRAIELFDPTGRFHGTRTLAIRGRHIYDAGTEVNDPDGGAAFSANGGDSLDQNGVIERHGGLNDFIGTEMVNGENLTSAFDPSTPIANVTICLDDGTDAPCAPQVGGGTDEQFDPRDVNEDGVVSALDALLIVNFLNQQNAGGNSEAPANLDVAGDGRVGALDALMVVNYLNQTTDEEESRRLAEGEAHDATLASMFADDVE